MKKDELIRLKDGYRELAEHYRLQANLKITEESRETSLKLAKRYEELNEIINREVANATPCCPAPVSAITLFLPKYFASKTSAIQ